MSRPTFQELFPNSKKVVIGMIHLAGATRLDRIARAGEELGIYISEGLDGAIIENYAGSVMHVETVLGLIRSRGGTEKFRIGVNVLGNDGKAFELASEYGASFVQLDTVLSPSLDFVNYQQLRQAHPHLAVLGGVRFKYQLPTGRSLQEDVLEGMARCEVVVTTGEGTGKGTPLEKLASFRKEIGDYPLFVGAGVNVDNAAKQLEIADGAIIGTYFKNGDIGGRSPVDPVRVREIMDIVRRI